MQFACLVIIFDQTGMHSSNGVTRFKLVDFSDGDAARSDCHAVPLEADQWAAAGAPSGRVPWPAAAVTDTTLQSSATSLPGKWKVKCQELAKAILAGDKDEAVRLAHTYHVSALL